MERPLKEIVHHEQQHQHHLNAEADDRGDDIGDGRGQPWEIDLAEHIGVGRKGVGVAGQAVGKIRPDGVAAQIKQERGNPVGADAGNAAEDKGLDDTGKQGRQEYPRGTKDGLLIAHHEIPFGEQVD